MTSAGRADVVVIGWDRDAVSVYTRTSAGTLAGPTSYEVPLGGHDDLEVADVNGDGLGEVIVAMSGQVYATPDLTVLIQQRGGGMAVHSYSVPGDTVNADSIGVGDVDGDGHQPGRRGMGGTVRVDVASLLRIQSWTDPACRVEGHSLTCAVSTLAAGGRCGVSVTVKAPRTGSTTTTAALTATSTVGADQGDNTPWVAVTVTKK